jgi:hypothetical protein
LLGRCCPGKQELLYFIAVFWIEIYGLNNHARASFVECLKLLKAIKVVEKVLKAFLKAMTYWQ